jgi:hypothetical protein
VLEALRKKIRDGVGRLPVRVGVKTIVRMRGSEILIGCTGLCM